MSSEPPLAVWKPPWAAASTWRSNWSGATLWRIACSSALPHCQYQAAEPSSMEGR